MTRNPFAVPEHALPAWERLQAGITRAGGTPCGDPSIRDYWTGSSAQQARAADRCMGCAALEQCLTYALAADEQAGVWGGLTAQQRTTQRKETA